MNILSRIEQFIPATIRDSEDRYLFVRAKIFVTGIWFFSILGSLALLSRFLAGPVKIGWYVALVCILILFSLPFLLHRGFSVQQLGLCFTFIVALIIGFGVMSTDGASTPVLVFLIAVPVIGVFFARQQGLIFSVGLVAAIISTLVILQITGYEFEPPLTSEASLRAMRLVYILLVIAIILGLVVIYDREQAYYQQLLQTKNAELSALNTKKNQLLGMAAHDLRNPIAVVIGYAELILKQANSIDPEHKRMMIRMKESCYSMVRLIDDVLDVSKIESGEYTLNYCHISPHVLFVNAVEINRFQAQKQNIDLILDISSEMPRTIFVDAEKMKQVIDNLISNAIKYSPPDTQIQIRSFMKGQTVILEVADQGQGIAEHHFEHIFDPFYRTNATIFNGERSIGLGLNIVKNIVEAHRGYIKVESQIGIGSTFRVELPT